MQKLEICYNIFGSIKIFFMNYVVPRVNEKPEERSYTSRGAQDRQLFDEIAGVVREDEIIRSGERSDVELLLKEFDGRLRQSDPLIALKVALESGRWNMDSPTLRVCTFKLVYPSLKSLNDLYLTPIEADAFLNDIREEFQSIFNSSVEPLSLKGSSGFFLIDFEDCKLKWNLDSTAGAEALFKEKVKKLQEKITEKLSHRLHDYFRELRERIAANDARLEELSKPVEDSNELRDQVVEQMKKHALENENFELKKKMTAVVSLINRLDDSAEESTNSAQASDTDDITTSRGLKAVGDSLDHEVVYDGTVPINSTVHVSVGLAPVKTLQSLVLPESLRLFSPLMCAQIAANMNARRTFHLAMSEQEKVSDPELDTARKDNGRRALAQEFSFDYLVKDMYKARSMLLHKVYDVAHNRIMDDYQDFFHIEDGRVRMRKSVINQFRKERLGSRFSSPFDNDGMRDVFETYYEAVNMLDILKPFCVENTGAYEKYVEKAVGLIQQLKVDMNVVDEKRLRSLAKEVADFLELSVKDEGSKIVSSIRGAIKNLLSSSGRGFVFLDHIGFGGENQSDYEGKMLEILDVIFQQNDGILARQAASDSEGFMSEKIVSLASNGGIKTVERFVLQAGDAGTAKIRSAERDIRKALRKEGLNVSVLPGGDEGTVIISAPEIDSQRVQSALLVIAERYKLRIFALIDDLKRNGDLRSEVVPFIWAKRVADMEMSAMKEKGGNGSVGIDPISKHLPRAS